ncbi:MAG: hypothetical protein ABEK01_02345 [Candidatus Nanohaloarchaea archaeon]
MVAQTAYAEQEKDRNTGEITGEALEEDGRGWSFGMLTAEGKEARRIADDLGELYIQETREWEDREHEYEVRYREGRLGPGETLRYGEFDDLARAHEYAELVREGEAEVEDLLGS